MKLLVGLGNPEKQYNGTYHNMGFFVLDKFAEKMGVEITKKKTSITDWRMRSGR